MKYSLTNPQNSIWLTEKFFSNTSINNISGYTYFDEKVNFDVLKNAINEIVKTNDSMRLKFKEENNLCYQYLADYKPFDIDIIKLSSEEDIKIKALEIAKVPFDLENNYLFKFILFKLPNNCGGYFLSAHHLIGDSWGLGLVVKQISSTYSAMLNNTYQEKINPSYINYINNEQQYLASDKFIKDKQYWNALFNNIPETASIPTFKKSSTIDNNCSGNRLNFNISKSKINKINNFCKENQISLYNFFMAIYSLYISRVCSIDDLVIGTPILNRTNFEQKNTTGMFISTAPLKINLNHDLSFIEFVKGISISTLALFRHQKYPYQYLLEDLRKKDSSIPNLYNVVLSYQITKTFDEESGINYKSEWVSNGCCADDLQIHLFDLNDESSITVAYDYKTNKYDENDISSLHNRILTIINQVVENNNILLKDIEIVTPEEKHKILYEFNDTYLDYPRDKTIVDLFEEQVEKTPDNIAVVFEDQKLTYRELNEKANQLANYLLSVNVKPKDVICVSLHKGLDFAISVFAILKCGATYLPILVDTPTDRISYIIGKSNSTHIICSKDNLYLDENIYSINISNIDYSNQCSSNLNNVFSNDTGAYIIFTSGSTGMPKGVQISHQNLINFIYSFNKLYSGLDSSDTFLSSTNIAFDVSVWEFFLPLLNGCCLFFNTTDIITDIIAYCNNIINYNITALYIPPNILESVYYILKENNYTKISKLLVGVESISNTTLNKYIELNPDIIIINGYGPTETTICATALKYTHDDSISYKVPIGKPLFNNKIYIMSHNSLCPIETPGELFVSGDGVGLGYINDSKKNKEAFFPDPFFEGKTMYSTGDIAYIRKDNTIQFIGRKDSQIKLHGYRIELGEIDSVLMKHPSILKSLSLLNDNKIITYYTCKENILSTDINTYLQSFLPFYMIPYTYICLDSFPLTSNGKIDKKALPKPTFNANHKHVEPKTLNEKILVNIWKNLFKESQIGITDNFFELGGDSLAAIKFQTEALKYNLKITYGDIFNNPTIKQLAELKSSTTKLSVDSNYDFSVFDDILNRNEISNIPSKIKKSSYKDFLLLGSTGFLGSHILDNLLSNTNSKIYCIVRDKNGIDSGDRLLKTLNFYFPDKYNNVLPNRVIVLNGDITLDNLGLSEDNISLINSSVSHIINSAALVKHYGDINKFNDINILGTQNIVKLAINLNKKLYHISTISVAGTTSSNETSVKKQFSEKDFYLEQDVNNSYIYTKFMSELCVLEAIKSGLQAKILRIGNISNRYSDGKFQINFSDNGYLNRLQAFINLKALPNYLKKHSIDFSPVEFCSDAIVKILLSENDFTVFHIFNTNLVSFKSFIECLNLLNYDIKFLDNNSFKDKLKLFLSTEEYSSAISGIIPDLDLNKNLNLIFDVIPTADFSTKFLEKVGFTWPQIDFDYFKTFINYFKNIGFLK